MTLQEITLDLYLTDKIDQFGNGLDQLEENDWHDLLQAYLNGTTHTDHWLDYYNLSISHLLLNGHLGHPQSIDHLYNHLKQYYQPFIAEAVESILENEFIRLGQSMRPAHDMHHNGG